MSGTAWDFAGTKGFVGGFGRGVLTAFGEPEIKTFARAAIDGQLDGRTTAGVPVHNVAISLLQAQEPSSVYRVFDI